MEKNKVCAKTMIFSVCLQTILQIQYKSIFILKYSVINNKNKNLLVLLVMIFLKFINKTNWNFNLTPESNLNSFSQFN